MIYADNAAQCPPSREAIDAAVYAMNNSGNPSGLHSRSSVAARLLFEARRKVAAALGAQQSEIIFTASGTEADNLAIFNGAANGSRHKIIVFAAEHKAVLNSAKSFTRIFGGAVEYIPCLPSGTADLDALAKMADGDTALVSLMHANNETGVIQPVAEAARIAHSVGALFHTDAVQTAGHIPVSVRELGADMLSISAHKFGGIAGAGALWCRANLKLLPLISGGGQERGLRSGTEALSAVSAMGTALEQACSAMAQNAARVSAMRDNLQERLSDIAGVRFPGGDSVRLPGTLCAVFPGHNGEQTALMLDRAGICVSAGAACTTGDAGASHVLTAMGISPAEAECAVRFSLGAENTADEIEIIAEKVHEIIR